jgi:hypothetical protein
MSEKARDQEEQLEPEGMGGVTEQMQDLAGGIVSDRPIRMRVTLKRLGGVKHDSQQQRKGPDGIQRVVTAEENGGYILIHTAGFYPESAGKDKAN